MELSELIRASKKSRSQIVDETGMSQAYLSLIESGARKVGPKYLRKLANSLGCSAVDLRPDLAALVSAPETVEVEATQ